MTPTKTDNVAKSVFVEIKRNQSFAIKSHRQVPVSLNTALRSGLLNKNSTNNDQIIPSDVLYDKERKSEDTFKYMALFFSGTYKVNMKVGSEPKIMYSIVFLINKGATPNLIDAAVLKPQWNSRTKRQESLHIVTENE